MLTVISPAKALDLEPVEIDPTDPQFPEATRDLAGTMRDKSVQDLRDLMGISEDLAKLNRERFQSFEETPAAGAVKPAAFTFAGDTFKGLDAPSLDEDALRWAQRHLRILSGLYGLLRPLDGIQPYRLEMGTKLKTEHGKSLYQFWGDTLAEALNAQAAETGSDTLLNCASQEYFKAVDRKALNLRVVTPVFLEDKGGKRSVVSFYAKQARGAMARFVSENRIEDEAGLRDFDIGGYRHDPEASEEGKPVFVRAA